MRLPIRLCTLAVAVAAFAGLTGCVSGPMVPARARNYRIEVKLDPATHHLAGHTSMDLALSPDSTKTAKSSTVAVEFLLHPGLRVDDVQAAGARVRRHRDLGPDPEDTKDPIPERHIVWVDAPSDKFTLFVDYDGTVYQDASAGEHPGEIHNFDMTAHVGEDGIYLAGGYWYPEPVSEPDADDPPTDFTLLCHPVEGMDLVAGGVTDPQLSQVTGLMAWHSPYPLTGMVLVGGHHDVYRTTHDGVAISAHLKPEQKEFAPGLLETAKRILDRYQPLIGPYPANEYSIVDNFFSSGFAFPTFTLLSSAVINMGERAQTVHGYIDHEMVHSWWGNGVLVDPSDGNWCESLTSYATNYYGYILDGDPGEARRKRRNYCHFLSRMKPEKDRPLGNYDRKDSCSRGVAYEKGAAVFNMLARRMGQDNFWAAMRDFNSSFVGKYASWTDIQNVCQKHTDKDLGPFFQQWVRRAGAPELAIKQAQYDSGNQILEVDLTAGGSTWDLNVPLRIVHAAGTLDVTVPMTKATQTVRLPVDVVPVSVELDPDYQIFRRVPVAQIIPTTASTRYGDKFTTVLPPGKVAKDYLAIQSIFESSFSKDERMTLSAGEKNGDALAERCLLILGNAVHEPFVAAFLSAVEFPVTWTDKGFEVSGVQYEDPGDAVLCTARHPGVPGGGITVVYANSDAAIPRPMTIPMYAHSMVIFHNKVPTVRLDLEKHEEVPVTLKP